LVIRVTNALHHRPEATVPWWAATLSVERHAMSDYSTELATVYMVILRLIDWQREAAAFYWCIDSVSNFGIQYTKFPKATQEREELSGAN